MVGTWRGGGLRGGGCAGCAGWQAGDTGHQSLLSSSLLVPQRLGATLLSKRPGTSRSPSAGQCDAGLSFLESKCGLQGDCGATCLLPRTESQAPWGPEGTACTGQPAGDGRLAPSVPHSPPRASRLTGKTALPCLSCSWSCFLLLRAGRAWQAVLEPTSLHETL